MKIKCWGARGSVPVSGKEYDKFGGDTTCIEIRTKDDDIIIVDSGTGIRNLGNRLVKDKKINLNILYTHVHWDHVQGLPFFKPIYIPETRLRIFGCPFSKKNVKEMIATLLNHPHFPVKLDDIPADIEYVSIDEESFSIGPMTITPIHTSHPNRGVGYKFMEDNATFVFITDNELSYAHQGGRDFEDYRAFCAGADLLMHDAEYTEEEYKTTKGWGHSVYKDALELAIKAGVKQFGLFHHNQNRADDGLDDIVKDCVKILDKKKPDLGCFAVRQGMEIILDKDRPLLIMEHAAARTNDEISQLKNTISALRDELEKKQIEKEENIQKSKLQLNNEITQLKNTISALRDSMAGNRMDFDKKLQETRQSAQSESAQLKQTISTLREALENRSGK